MGVVKQGFVLTLPDDWENQTIYTFKGPDDGDTQHFMTLVLDREAGEADLEEYAEEQIDSVMGTLQGAEVLKQATKMLPNGEQAYECVIKWIPVDGTRIFRKQQFVIRDGVAYVFAANFTKKTLKTIGRQMDEIVASLAAG